MTAIPVTGCTTSNSVAAYTGSNSVNTIPSQIVSPKPAFVVVYYPSIWYSMGHVPFGPTIDTGIDVRSSKHPVRTLTASRLNVHITLNAGVKDATFQPVTLHVDGTASDMKPYHRNYSVTTSPVHLVKNRSKNYRVIIDVPPDSGTYTIIADSPTFKPAPRTMFENIIFVDHGGYYRTGIIRPNIHQQHGTIGFTVKEVNMTRIATHVKFVLTGAPGAGHAPFADDEHTVLQQIVKHNGRIYTLNSEHMGWAGGPVHGPYDTTVTFDWEGDPTRSDTQAIELTIKVPIFNNWRLQRYEKFHVVIPIKAQR
jgi:hypothetical protein